MIISGIPWKYYTIPLTTGMVPHAPIFMEANFK